MCVCACVCVCLCACVIVILPGTSLRKLLDRYMYVCNLTIGQLLAAGAAAAAERERLLQDKEKLLRELEDQRRVAEKGERVRQETVRELEAMCDSLREQEQCLQVRGCERTCRRRLCVCVRVCPCVFCCVCASVCA